MAYNVIVPTEPDFAYAAGIIDGEGSICVSRKKTQYGQWTYCVTVEVTVTDIEIPVWLKGRFGGSFHPKHDKRVRNKPSWRWVICARKAATFLSQIEPFLLVKASRAHAAIELIHAHRFRGGRLPFTAHATPLTDEELEKREKLALHIRSENAKGKPYIRENSTWGIN